jgi:hypothetical protein
MDFLNNNTDTHFAYGSIKQWMSQVNQEAMEV